MDDLVALLDGPRAHHAFLLRCAMRRPWAIDLRDEAPLSLTAVVDGELWVRQEGRTERLGPGDVVISVGTAPWTAADGPETAETIRIGPGQECSAPDGTSLTEVLDRGVRTWGTADIGGHDDLFVTGAYWLDGELGRRLLVSLPRLLVLSAGDLDSPLVDLLAVETGRDLPGQEAVLDRLLDLLLVTCLRTWFARSDVERPAWWAGRSDPVVGPVLQLMQHRPEHPWTVGELAGAAGLSRAAFARRFTAVLGEPPMSFLTRWRVLLAADLLLDPDRTLASVAAQVGYSTPFALSSAFKRELGVSPQAHREAGRASA